jgi:hypothetical protein
MNIDMVERKDVKIIKADVSLQKRIGIGPLDDRVVERCQKVIDTNTVDFDPLAAEYLDKLREAIAVAKSRSGETKDMIQKMTEPVMQLKANAATFRYTLVGNLANIMLGFLEAVDKIDSNVIEIVAAHEKTLSIIIAKKMTGDGGAHGKLFEQELQNACARYFSSKK